MHPIDWQDIALRLLATIVAGFLIGFNRGEHERPAGMRTSLLVCLAAAIAMIQANLLLDTSGKGPSSFVTMDIMRLPLGILTGVGFIGAGAIFQRDNLVVGVTTAATLWFVTVIGLCFGGGQLALGAAATLIALLILSGLRVVELHLQQDRTAVLTLTLAAETPGSADIIATLASAGIRTIKLRETLRHGAEPLRTLELHVRWRGFREDPVVPAPVSAFASADGVVEVAWHP